MRKYVAHHAGLNNGVRIKLMSQSMIASKYDLVVVERDKYLATVVELRVTMSQNNQFYFEQLLAAKQEIMNLKEQVSNLTLNKSRRVS